MDRRESGGRRLEQRQEVLESEAGGSEVGLSPRRAGAGVRAPGSATQEVSGRSWPAWGLAPLPGAAAEAQASLGWPPLVCGVPWGTARGPGLASLPESSQTPWGSSPLLTLPLHGAGHSGSGPALRLEDEPSPPTLVTVIHVSP